MPLEHLAVLPGARLELEPLRVEHAQEMAPLLDDPGLHTYIGGRPATLAQLQERYRRQVVGRSPAGSQLWLNWVARRREDARAVGTVQATVTDGAAGQDGPTAEVAWVVATAYQGQGYAREAAQVMVTWLRAQGAIPVVGARTATQLAQSLGTVGVELSDGHLARLDEVSQVPLGWPREFLRGTDWTGSHWITDPAYRIVVRP